MGTNIGIFQSFDRGNSWSQIVAPKPVTTTQKNDRRGSKAAVKPTPNRLQGPTIVPALTEKVKILSLYARR